MVASHSAQQIYEHLDQLNAYHRNVDSKLRRLRSDVHLSGIFVRDYLLDTERDRASESRQRLAEFRTNDIATLSELATLAHEHGLDGGRIERLQATLNDYWEALEPLFDWTPVEKQTLSATFLRRKVIPRRNAVMAIAQQIEELNNANLEAQRTEVARQYADFTAELRTLMWRSLALGIVVTLSAVIRLRILERRSEQQRAASEQAERVMRHLSQQLVATQEQERKKLSRELHDHVGQLLTALRLEIGRVDRLRGGAPGAAAGTAIAECRQIVDNLVRVVRDLALGLRPSMLDDLGLEPALEWLVRDVGRRSCLVIDLSVDDTIEVASEPQRTCIYRVVQEALTNACDMQRPPTSTYDSLTKAADFMSPSRMMAVGSRPIGGRPAWVSAGWKNGSRNLKGNSVLNAPVTVERS
jgi:hypothetical protein